MNLGDIRLKLEFDKIVDILKKHCSSPLGLNLCNEIGFFNDKNILDKEINKVSQMKFLIDTEGVLDFNNLFDVYESIEKLKIQGSRLSPDKYLWLLNFLRISRRIKAYIKSFKNTDDIFEIRNLTDNLFSDRLIENRIESSIDEEGKVKDSASSELRKIRKSIIDLHTNLRKQLSSILRLLSEKEYSQDDIITLRDGRSVIPVKVENKRKVKGIIHSTSASGATVFIEPAETTELNNDIIELQFKEQREIEKILLELSDNLRSVYNDLKNNYSILSELDYIHAKSLLANQMNAVRPELVDENFDIINAYHPILLLRNGKKNVIPNDFELSNEINTVIITGPNAGGKTVALKTLGLIQMMLQSGMLVPAGIDSKFRIFKKLFINIGDEQSLDNDLSSFSSHLKSLNEIIRNADESTLILIDEICSGTDPRFASSLASSILTYLSGKNSVTYVTTHIGDLKSYAIKGKKILNASMEFDTEFLKPTFKLVKGVPGQSFTFEIASRYLESSEIIEMAKQNLNSEQFNLEEVIGELNRAKDGYIKLNRKYAADTDKLNGILRLYSEKLDDLTKREKSIINNAKDEAALILNKANKLIENTIRKIKEDNNVKIGQLKRHYRSETEKITKKTSEVLNENLVSFELNDYVKLKNSTSYGKIIEIKGNDVVLLINGMTVRSCTDDIIKVDEFSDKTVLNYDYEISLKEGFKSKLDLRGMYTDEIKDVLEKFIYEGHINSLSELIVVHGKGEGKLRNEVHRQLRKMSYVKNFRLGGWNEGETGVTIIELK